MDKQKKEQKKKKKRWLLWILLILLILLLFWRCSREEAPDFIREYEEHIERQYDNMEAGDNARLNMAVSQLYEISDKQPFFYIGYPENNGYDIVLSFFSDSGELLYQTKYIAPGTNVKIPGGDFAEKGLREYSCNIAAYGITGGDTMVQVAINKEHSGFGRLLGPATERYDISSTVLETIDGEEKGTVSADDCYYNLLAVKGMDGKTSEDISTMDLSVEVPADSFVPRYKGTYYTCVPLVITIEETEIAKATGLYGNDGIAFVSWDEMIAKEDSYYDNYRDKTLTDFSVFYLEDNGKGYTLTSNYELYYMYSINGEEFKSTELPNTDEIDNGKYNTGHYNYSCSYLNNTYDYISGNLVLPEGITVLGEHAFDCITNFRAVVLPDSLTTIKSHAFDNQWNAITITMGTGVTTIEDNAFLNASGLSDIYYEGTQEQWKAINIGETGNDILSTVTIHYIAEY